MLPDVKNLSKEDMALGKKLLLRFRAGQISVDEFEKETAYFAMQCGFNELRYKPSPSRPVKLMEYDRLDRDEKRQMPDRFWQDPNIINYFKQKSYVQGENAGIQWWLTELKTRFEKYGDAVNAERCGDRMGGF